MKIAQYKVGLYVGSNKEDILKEGFSANKAGKRRTRKD
jgi:hypothetical protein